MRIHLLCGDADYVATTFREASLFDLFRACDMRDATLEISGSVDVQFYYDEPEPEGVDTDFPYAPTGNTLIMSNPAISALQAELAGAGPVLPIEPERDGQYKLFFPANQIVALDRDASEWHVDNGVSWQIKRYAFIPEAIAGQHVFRVQNLVGRVFVSDQFVARVVECGLTGLRTQAVWSSEDGPLVTIKELSSGYQPDPALAGMTLSQKRARMRAIMAGRR